VAVVAGVSSLCVAPWPWPWPWPWPPHSPLTPLPLRRSPHARIEYIAQHQVEQLDLKSTPLDFLLSNYRGDGGETWRLKMRMHLAKFGLGGETLPLQRISTLSGGQKCRLCLAVAMYRRPHLLVLDEPTNHLDMETVDSLISAIKDFKGGLVVVSHDQHLLGSVCNELWVVGEGKVKPFRGTFSQYKQKVVPRMGA